MLFQVHVVVVRAVREGLRYGDPGALDDRDDGWSEAVAYSFGINAESAAAAVSEADRAAEHARGRDGDYIGGVVAELQVSRVRADRFDGYEKYLLQPLSKPGIFYVTGTTSFGAPHEMIAGALDAVSALRDSIRQRGLPPPSFAHPKPPDPSPPKRVRILCPGCHKWAEVDSTGVVYSLMDGLDSASPESEIGRRTGRTLGAFIEGHSSCLKYSRDIAFSFLYEGDPRYDAVDPAMRE